MGDDLFLSEQHPVSRRWAVLEDDGRTVWLYLTAPDETKPIASCWLYNRVEAPPGRNFERGETPVVPATYASITEPLSMPEAERISFRWSGDGHSVAVSVDGEPFGFIANAKNGYSKHLRAAGPYGSPLDRTLYAEIFRET